MIKKLLRKEFSERRNHLTQAQVQRWSHDLVDRFFSLLDPSFSVLHTYLPINTRNEPDTRILIERVRAQWKHIQISIPKTDGRGNMDSFYFEGWHQIRLNPWHIPEPVFGEITPALKIDVVIVPLLTFDRRLHRVGYGKGYYDRFLLSCRKDCRKIGFSFFPPVDQIEDVGEDDITLHEVISPDGVYQPQSGFDVDQINGALENG